MRWISEIQVFLLIILCFFGTAIQGEPEPQLGVPFPDGKTCFFLQFWEIRFESSAKLSWQFYLIFNFEDVNIFPNNPLKMTIVIIC